jgi:RimJ/RimL family protein N-acetyltransferase
MAGKTSQFYMRPMTMDDVPTIAGWFEQLADHSLFDSRAGLPANAASIEKDWQKSINGAEPRTSFWFSVDDAQSNLAAIVGLENVSYINGDGVLPLILASQERSKGLGIRIVAMVLDMAFDQLRLNRVTTFYRADNAASAKLINGIGFVEEGRMRQARYAGGHYHDQIFVGMLAQEWPEHRANLVQSLNSAVDLHFGRAGQKPKAWPARLI